MVAKEVTHGAVHQTHLALKTGLHTHSPQKKGISSSISCLHSLYTGRTTASTTTV